MANMYSKLIDKVKEKGNAIEGEMSFFQHLEALRWHVIRAAAAILVFAIIAFVYYDSIFDNILMAPTKIDFWTYRMMCNMGGFLHGLSSYFNPDSFCVKSISVHLINTEIAGQFKPAAQFIYHDWSYCRYPIPAI